MTNEHTFLEKYTSYTLLEMVAKGLCVRGELETEQIATYWPQVPLSFAALLSHYAGLLNQGSWWPCPRLGAGSWELVLTASNCNSNFNCLTPTNSNSLWHRVISLFDIHLLPVSVAFVPNSIRPRSRLYFDIFERMHLFLDWRLGRRSICYIRTLRLLSS